MCADYNKAVDELCRAPNYYTIEEQKQYPENNVENTAKREEEELEPEDEDEDEDDIPMQYKQMEEQLKADSIQIGRGDSNKPEDGTPIPEEIKMTRQDSNFLSRARTSLC
jgi:hypothetical protein